MRRSSPSGDRGGSSTHAKSSWIETRAAAFGAVAVLTLAGLALRLHGIGCMLPHVLEPDGGVIMRQVMLMHSDVATPENESNWSAYPHLVARFIALFPDAEKWKLASNDLAGHLAAASAPLLQARIGIAVLSVLLVPATWFLARRFLSRGAALFATASMSASLLAVWFAQQCRPHGPAAMTALCAVLAALRMRERPTIGSYILAGIAAGAAIGTLQSGVAVLFPLLAAHMLRRRDGMEHAPRRASDGSMDLAAYPVADAAAMRRSGRWLILIAFVLIGAMVCLFYPFLLKASGDANAPVLAYTGPTLEFFGHSVFLGMFNAAGFATVASTLWCFEIVASLLALGGLIAWLAKRDSTGERKLSRAYWRTRPELCVVLAYAVPYAIVIGMYERTYERFVLQLLPYVIVLAAFGAARCASWLCARGAPRALLAAGAIVLLGVPAFGTLRLVRLRAAPDTGTLVARWIEKNVSPGSERVLVVPFLDFPVWHTEEALVSEESYGWTSPWQNYQKKLVGHAVEGERYDLRSWPITKKAIRDIALEDPIAFAKHVNAKYVIINVPIVTEGDAIRPPFLRALHAGAKLELRVPIQAQGIAGEPALAFEHLPGRDAVNWSVRLLSKFSASGLVTEVYSIP